MIEPTPLNYEEIEAIRINCKFIEKHNEDATNRHIEDTDRQRLLATIDKLKEELEKKKQIISVRVEDILALEKENVKLKEEIVNIEIGDQKIRFADAKAHREKINYLKEENIKLKERLQDIANEKYE